MARPKKGCAHEKCDQFGQPVKPQLILQHATDGNLSNDLFCRWVPEETWWQMLWQIHGLKSVSNLGNAAFGCLCAKAWASLNIYSGKLQQSDMESLI